MKILFIGGTGLISSACVSLAVERGMDVTLLNRSVSTKLPPPLGVSILRGDVKSDPGGLADLLRHQRFDVVVDFIAYTPADVERDLGLFLGQVGQYIFISSASAYQKPPAHYIITEQTPLHNPYWQYSRDKIACEDLLTRQHQASGFPVTIVRPSLTYGVSQIPLAVGCWQMPYTQIARALSGEPLIVPGDGASLWVLTWNADFARGLVGLFGNQAAIGESFHITSDEVLTWDQIYSEFFAALGLAPNLIHIPSDLIARYNDHATGSLIGDKANSAVFDNSKIKRFVPDFSCPTPWRQGVRQAVAWFQADPARQQVDAETLALWDRIIQGYRRAFPG